MNRSRFRQVLGLVFGAGALLATTGCGIYVKFRTPQYDETAPAYGDLVSTDSVSLGAIAQQSLLTARIGEIANRLTGISSVVTLYEALGCGLQ